MDHSIKSCLNFVIYTCVDYSYYSNLCWWSYLDERKNPSFLIFLAQDWLKNMPVYKIFLAAAGHLGCIWLEWLISLVMSVASQHNQTGLNQKSSIDQNHLNFKSTLRCLINVRRMFINFRVFSHQYFHIRDRTFIKFESVIPQTKSILFFAKITAY